jgi:hypothetical protein
MRLAQFSQLKHVDHPRRPSPLVPFVVLPYRVAQDTWQTEAPTGLGEGVAEIGVPVTAIVQEAIKQHFDVLFYELERGWCAKFQE